MIFIFALTLIYAGSCEFDSFFDDPFGMSHPEYLIAAANSITEVSLQWEYASDEEIGFGIESFLDGSFIEIGRTEQDETHYLDTSPEPNALQVYRVYAFSQDRESGYSNEAIAYTYFTDFMPGSVNIEPSSLTVGTEASFQIEAIASYEDNLEFNITEIAEWGSDDIAVATVTSDGYVASYAEGSAKITATFNNVSGSMSLTVGTKKRIDIKPWKGVVPSSSGEYTIPANSGPVVSWTLKGVPDAYIYGVDVFFGKIDQWRFNVWCVKDVPLAVSELVYGTNPGGTEILPSSSLQYSGYYTLVIIAYDTFATIAGMGYVTFLITDGVDY